MDKCHVCRQTILPGQDTEECNNCGQIGHESHGQWGRSRAGQRVWTCYACLWEELAYEAASDKDLRATPAYWEGEFDVQ